MNGKIAIVKLSAAETDSGKSPSAHEVMSDQASPIYDKYIHQNLGVRVYCRFEEKFLTKALGECQDQKIAVDLGCGNGRLTSMLSDKFEHVHAIDISQGMLDEAQAKLLAKNVTYHKTDVFESGLPFADNSVDFICGGFGFFSFAHKDAIGFVHDQFLSETFRVLKSGGSILLGCYNKDRISAYIDLPFHAALGAKFVEENRLCVTVGGRSEVIPAQPKSVNELKSLMKVYYTDIEVKTFGVNVATLPNDMLLDEKLLNHCERIDETLALNGDRRGQYIIVKAMKKLSVI